jgi:hypothetical protein
MPVANAAPFKTAVTFETRVVQTPSKDATQGKTACPFEDRVTQEAGAH